MRGKANNGFGQAEALLQITAGGPLLHSPRFRGMQRQCADQASACFLCAGRFSARAYDGEPAAHRRRPPSLASPAMTILPRHVDARAFLQSPKSRKLSPPAYSPVAAPAVALTSTPSVTSSAAAASPQWLPCPSTRRSPIVAATFASDVIPTDLRL